MTASTDNRRQTEDAEQHAGDGRSRESRKVFLTQSVLNAELGKRQQGQKVIWDSKQDGLCVLVSTGPKGRGKATVTFRVCFYLRSIPGKPHYVKLGRYPRDHYVYPYKDRRGEPIVAKCSDIAAMRSAASDIRSRAKTQGIDPRRSLASDLFEDVVADFIELKAKKTKSWPETQRIFDRYVLPEWRYKSIKDIDKAAVTHLLDKIEKKKIKYKGGYLGGPIIADAVLVRISTLFNWHAARSSDFTSPVVKGMKRGESEERSLFLNDAELRVLWPLLDRSVHGAVLKTALLTAQRFHKVSGMRRSDLKAQLTVPGHYNADKQWIDNVQIDNVWDAGRDSDPKNKQVSAVPLSAMAREVIDAVPDQGSDYVFTLNGRGAIGGWSRFKKKLDADMKKVLREQGLEFREWQHRDLRRTAKTLIMRAGVSRDISERCLAHVIGGVEGVYDRHDYLREKQEAFNRLAVLVDRIVNPPSDNVVSMQPRLRPPA